MGFPGDFMGGFQGCCIACAAGLAELECRKAVHVPKFVMASMLGVCWEERRRKSVRGSGVQLGGVSGGGWDRRQANKWTGLHDVWYESTLAARRVGLNF